MDPTVVAENQTFSVRTNVAASTGARLVICLALGHHSIVGPGVIARADELLVSPAVRTSGFGSHLDAHPFTGSSRVALPPIGRLVVSGFPARPVSTPGGTLVVGDGRDLADAGP